VAFTSTSPSFAFAGVRFDIFVVFITGLASIDIDGWYMLIVAG